MMTGEDQDVNIQVDRDDLIFPAPRMTMFLYHIFEARSWIKNKHKSNKKIRLQPFIDFVQRVNLDKEEAWASIGFLPAVFDKIDHRFIIKVPYVVPGEQLIMWNTWYTTAGSDKKSLLPVTKVSSSIDMVPLSYFNPEERSWYKYINHHAPVDMGQGGTGAYLTFVHKAWEDSCSPLQNTVYGLPEECLEMFDNGLRHLATDNDDYQGRGTLTVEQKERFYHEGYLIVDIPSSLVSKLPVQKSLDNLTQYYRLLSKDESFNVMPEYPTPSRIGTLKGTKFKTTDSLNPFVRKAKSLEELIPKQNNGSGPGTSFLLEPFHLAFQYSSFVHNLLSSFYRPGMIEPLLVVQEPFRVETRSTQWRPPQINNIPFQLIPSTHHQYRFDNRLFSF
jgi:hypothetical protein